jgi:membrane protease YdiL (CAAX protease family)
MSVAGEGVTAPRFRATPLAVFLVLAIALSWYPWILALLRHSTSGPNPLGLFVAALIATAVDAGWRGPRDLLLGIVRVRVPLSRWLAALLIPIGIVIVSLAAGRIFGMAIQALPPDWSDLLARFIFTLLFVALGEEPAWRGFLLPHLQRRFQPLAATLLISVVWAIWHVPLWGNEFAWNVVPAFLVSLLGGAFVLSWLYNSARQSILVPMLMHATLNTISAGYAFHLVGKSDLFGFWWLYAGLWLIVAAIILAATKGRLGLGNSR